jgi:hypothetical protein
MEDFVIHRRANYRQKTPRPMWRGIPDEAATALFDALRSNRDRALVSFYLSSGVRASELLGLRHGDLDAGHYTITVTSKGSRAGKGAGIGGLFRLACALSGRAAADEPGRPGVVDTTVAACSAELSRDAGCVTAGECELADELVAARPLLEQPHRR